MSEEIRADVLVLGGGPGGYVAAIRAGQLGLDTILVEADRPGGTCLLRGCIPSKALIHVAAKFAGMEHAAREPALGIGLSGPPTIDLAATMLWKDGIVDRLSGGVTALLKRAKVRVIRGWGTMRDGKTCEVAEADGSTTTVRAGSVVLATGSEPAALPSLPFGPKILSSTEILSLRERPRRLAVVGAGYIGLELGTVFARLGTQVTVIEAADTILPGFDAELAAPVARWLEAAGVTLHLGTKASGFRETEEGVTLALARGDGSVEELTADLVLVAAGRRPRIGGWGLDGLPIDRDGPFVRVDETCRTSMTGVYAIGDLVGEPLLAHKASAQGEMVAEVIAGRRRRFAPAAIPAICFTEPEIVSVGLSPAEAAARGLKTKVGRFPFAANGRALTLEGGRDGGFVRILANAADHRVIGVQAVGTHISELSAAFVTAIEMGAVLDDVAATIQAHPTLGEAFHEAALAALGHAIHA
ncbi:dihydrolipoyl dehydrogenase [Enterovirga rhinocerotis]|uniref:Dihydrolipoyl dehydrogenase n=1 Tax=Enterovirga rhinocerotis TaxID=1339210 RepID=A0A4R7C719_9HYPH|nr:dihydrolipoyl dehydrogenase [Enterovirga rhinocerotis]TDR93035.1 dihydrolipoamide dehydrogenase [Enterovirga rhinocerotis]